MQIINLDFEKSRTKLTGNSFGAASLQRTSEEQN